jgi:hypothetical protein
MYTGKEKPLVGCSEEADQVQEKSGSSGIPQTPASGVEMGF